ncbi:MAG: hypothetical protein ACRDLB_13210, partial [Actinomycetota bacterium]
GKLWDPLGDHGNFMLLLPGPLKVVIIVEVPQVEREPWTVSRDNLPQIEHHFWDWTLWLGSKELRGAHDRVDGELTKMHDHLLTPLGVRGRPKDLRAAVDSYRRGRAEAEHRLGVKIDRRMEEEVTRALRDAGVL